MKMSEEGLELIKEFEGCKLEAYKCPAGVWTIGVGSTLYEDGSKVQKGDYLESEDEAMDLLALTLGKYEQSVAKAVHVPITQNEFDALVSFTYNVGGANLASSTLLKLLNSGESKSIVAQEFHKWNKAGGKELAGLTRRRQAEARLFLAND